MTVNQVAQAIREGKTIVETIGGSELEWHIRDAEGRSPEDMAEVLALRNHVLGSSVRIAINNAKK